MNSISDFVQSVLQAEIAHHRADHRPPQGTHLLASRRQNVEHLVTVNEYAIFVRHHDPVAIPV